MLCIKVNEHDNIVIRSINYLTIKLSVKLFAMLYLEDYLEMIEHLPQELRDRFTEIRELDLTVHNSLDSMEKRQKSVFLQCKRGELSNEAAEVEFENIRREYDKVLEDADEKVTIASQLHDLVERYMRRLDSELFKFKCELEADHKGITEILEKRSLEMDGSSSLGFSLANISNNQKENRFFATMNSVNCTSISHSSIHGTPSGGMLNTSSGAIKDHRHRTPKVEKRRDSGSSLPLISEKRSNIGSLSIPSSVNVVRTVASTVSPAQTSSMAYSLQQLGGSASTAIAAAASQAIVATQQMQQGRRTASLKASYEAIHGGAGAPTEFWINRDIANALTVASSNPLPCPSADKKQKKKITSNMSHTNSVPHTSLVTSLTPSPNVGVDTIETLGTAVLTSNSTVPLSTSGLMLETSISTSNRTIPMLTSANSSLVPPNLPLLDSGLSVDQSAESEWSYDPNEPRYCICNQVSYGDMVACDNDACPYEWFHYPCVEITQPPKGKWYCPKCTQTMRRRGNRKN